MIFVTVGTQLPFDRLVKAVDAWAKATGRSDVFAQTGEGGWQPEHMGSKEKLTPGECRDLINDASIIVAHAGMGTIISAIEAGKPLVIIPRLFEFGEHRNDHQVATCERFTEWPNVFVAMTAEELPARIEEALACPSFEATVVHPSAGLLNVVDDFLTSTRHMKDVDGVICFGGLDWWYHNRGHYDIQMMRELSRIMPVLYVNSIGMRTPGVGEGRVFFKRVARKVRSWARGLKLVRKNFGVLSPVSIPMFHKTPWAKALLADQVREAARYMEIRNPLLWVACPPAAEVVGRIPAVGMVYQRTDRMEHFPGVNAERIREYDLELKRKADLTVFCSSSVFNDERAECQEAAFVDHGVDYENFAAAGISGTVPNDVDEIPRPRIGFVGGIDAHTFDPDLFKNVVSEMPDCSFVMVGGCSLPEGWCAAKNVYFLGRKPYEQVADYMAACDILIMPWNRSPWIKACNPVKLKEYLAVGRPVVSTPFDELSQYEGFVSVAADTPEFVRAIRSALENPPVADTLRARVEQETWAAKANSALAKLDDIGVHFQTEIAHQISESEISNAVATENAGQTQIDSHEPSKSYWKTSTLVAAGLMALAGFWLTRDAWQDIFRLASNDEESSHVFLALPAALWLAWARKDEVHKARRSGTWLGPCMVALGWLFVSVGDVQLFQSMWHFGSILIVVGCIITVLGREVLMRLWPAFAILVFLVPVPGIVRAQIAPEMQTVTAQMTAYLLQTFGEPVTLSGKVLIVNGIQVGIAEACNGIRMVFALALVCFFFAFSAELRTSTRLLVILASPLVAIAVNVLRLVPTVWLYGHASTGTAETFHDVLGWAMMPVALLGLVGLNSVLTWAFQEEPAAPEEYGDPPKLETTAPSNL